VRIVRNDNVSIEVSIYPVAGYLSAYEAGLEEDLAELKM